MKNLETIATIGADGTLTLNVPDVRPGLHRIRIEIDEEFAGEQSGKDAPAKPRETFKGRPVYSDEDRAKMKPSMPSEEAWVKDLLNE